MSVKLNEVVLWGRSLAEYGGMFNLEASHLNSRILGCADGPASFNAELTELGGRVVSCDPIYEFSRQQIHDRFEASIDLVICQVKAHTSNYVWGFHKNADDLVSNRRKAMAGFLSDYEQGLKAGRYVKAELPCLPFEDGQFDLALCSHFLFLYSHLFSLDFHLTSLLELSRVARDVRIFPLTGLDCQLSPHLPHLLERLEKVGLHATVQKSNYQLQKNGDSFLRLQKLYE